MTCEILDHGYVCDLFKTLHLRWVLKDEPTVVLLELMLEVKELGHQAIQCLQISGRHNEYDNTLPSILIIATSINKLVFPVSVVCYFISIKNDGIVVHLLQSYIGNGDERKISML